MDYSIYRQLIAPINKSCITPHYNFPCHNLLSEEFLENLQDLRNPTEAFEGHGFLIPYFKTFNYRILSSYPLISGSGLLDSAADLIGRKLIWERKLKDMQIHNIKEAVKSIKSLKKNKETKLTKGIVRYIKHIEKDPQPNFSGSYNWLYTGGNLVLTRVQNGVLLLGADNVNNLAKFNIFKLNSDLMDIKLVLSTTLKKKLPILQITSKAIGEELLIAIRQINNISLFKYNIGSNNFQLVKLWRKKSSKNKILTSADNTTDCLAVVTVDRKSYLHLYDIQSRRKIFCFSIRNHRNDNWNQVILNENNIYFANRNLFSTLDKRESSKKPVSTFSPTIVTNECENICSILKSNLNSNYLYLAYTHGLIQLDLRCMKAIQKWTHMLKNPPQFMCCLDENGTEFVVLQSRKVNDIVGIVNEWRNLENKFQSESLPCALTSINDFLVCGQKQGLCLNPNVSSRFDFTVTGLQCLKDDKGDKKLFTIGSGGDIFLSEIVKSKCDKGENKGSHTFLEKMKGYENHFETHLEHMFTKQHIQAVNMKRILGECLHSTDAYEFAWNNPNLFWKYHEMYSEESLKFYKDVVAQKILNVWGIDSEDFESNNLVNAYENNVERVKKWIEGMT